MVFELVVPKRSDAPAPAAPLSAAAPAWCRRVESGQLYLASGFQEARGAIQGAVQNALQALNWDPIDGRLVTLSAAPAGAGDPADAALRLTRAQAAADWLQGAGDGGLHLLQLAGCVAAGLAPERPMREALALLQAYKARGGQGVYMGGDGFFWRLSTHLALPGPIGRLGADPRASGWHAEGGEYRRARDDRFDGLWRRRRPADGGPGADLARENRRPADSFDPRPSARFEPLGDQPFGLDLGGNRAEVRFRPFVARLARLRPWPPSGPERPAETPPLGPSRPPEATRLAAWYAPCDSDPILTWHLSPALD